MEEILEKCNCCNCQQPLKDSKYLNAIPTVFKMKWEGPKMGNFLYPQLGETAVAYVCDTCYKEQPGAFQFIVTDEEGEYELKSIKDLEVIKIFNVHPHDRRFEDSPYAGYDCQCSRCLQMIGEEDSPIRIWPEEKKGDVIYEYRYHPKCIGAKTLDAY